MSRGRVIFPWLNGVCSFLKARRGCGWLEALRIVLKLQIQVWLMPWTACIGHELECGQEVAPFLCPIDISWSSLWGGKRCASSLGLPFQRLWDAAAWFPSSKHTRFSWWRKPHGASLLQLPELLLCPSPSECPHGLHPLRWAWAPRERSEQRTVMRVGGKWKRRQHGWGAAPGCACLSLSCDVEPCCS